MLVFFFTDIEGSTRLWEEHTAEMGAVIARHDAILQQQIEARGGRITKHTGDGVTASFETGQPVVCALEIQKRFAEEPWGAVGELRIRVGLHAGQAQWIAGAEPHAGDYHGPPVNCTARVMSAAWGGQILLTPEVTRIADLPEKASVLDLGQHLLKNVTGPQQLLQLLHPDLIRQEFPPPRTLSGESIRRAVDRQGSYIAGLPPPSIAVALVSATLVPMLQGDLSADSPALVGNLGILDDLGAVALRAFTAEFAARLQAGRQAGQAAVLSKVRQRLQGELLARWETGDDTALALRADASQLLQAVHGVQAAMTAASDDLRMALARGLAELGSQFGEFRWMLAGVQDTLAKLRTRQELQLAMQREQLEKTDQLLQLHMEQVRAPVLTPQPEAARPPAFLEDEEERFERPVFVAREGELARLESFLQTALAGQGRVIFASGGPGRGKTALLNEFAQQAMDAHGDLLVADGTCNAYSGAGDPYLPFREILDMLTADVESRWSSGGISREHARRLWDALPIVAQALLDHGPHVIGSVIRGSPLLDRAARAAPRGAPWLQRLAERVEQQRARSESLDQSHLYQQTTNVLRALAEVHPLLVVLDDLQWADTASIGLLFHLGRRLEGGRILISGAYRPEEVALGRRSPVSGERERHPLEKVLSEFKRAHGDVSIDLGQVEETEDRRFVDAFLESEPNRLDEAFRRALFEHTGGHALFTIELLRAMQERGDLMRDRSGRWVEGSTLDWDALPARVEAVIEERISRLEVGLRETLTVAAVEGEEFTAQVVSRVQETGERKMLQTLSRQLERRHRLVKGQGEVPVGRQRLSRYRFAHALFQQYLYNDLSPGESRLLHKEVAAVLEKLHAGHTEAVAVQLARHYGQAGDDARALRYETLAGDAALSSYANREAEAHYRRALELARTEAERAHLLAGLGEALRRLGSMKEARQVWREGIGLCQAVGNLDGVAGLYSRLSLATFDAGDPAESLRLCEEGLEAVAGASESREQAQLLHETARASYFAGLPDEARPLSQRALEMAERLGAVDVEADALATWGILPSNTPEESLKALERAVGLAEEAGFPLLASRAHNNLAFQQEKLLGDLPAARHHYGRAAELSRRAGDIVGQMVPLSNVIYDAVSMGDLGEAEAHLQRMRRLAPELDVPGVARRLVVRSEVRILTRRGDWADAARLARECLREARQMGHIQHETGASLTLANVLLEAHFAAGESSVHERNEARHLLTRCLEEGEASADDLDDTWCHFFLSALSASRGRLEEARSHLEEAKSLARRRPGTLFEAFALGAEGGLAMAEERWPEAQAAFEAMVRLYEKLGLRWHWARGLMDWAEALTGGGEPADLQQAEGLLRQSRSAFEEMGAPGYVAVVQGRLNGLADAGE
jgi:class 3 adenylate cyclase/tetratricopeptide (TPR) repeat protein